MEDCSPRPGFDLPPGGPADAAGEQGEVSEAEVRTGEAEVFAGEFGCPAFLVAGQAVAAGSALLAAEPEDSLTDPVEPPPAWCLRSRSATW